jgi:hypothetical protein
VFGRISQWAKDLDAGVASRAGSDAVVARADQEAALAAQREAHAAGILGSRSVDSISDEVRSLISRPARPGLATPMVEARDAVAQAIYGGAAPDNLRTPAGQQQLMEILQQMEVGSGAAVGPVTPAAYSLAQSLAQAKALRNPSPVAQAYGAMAGLNEALAPAGNYGQRGALYAGILGGGAMAVPPLTAAGQGIVALVQHLMNGQENEERSRQGVQV